MSNLSVKPIFNYGKKAAKWAFDKLPSIELKNGKILNGIKWAGQHISSPQNRVILGATALMSQPFIDLHNRNVDEETRKVSAARTVAKIIAGTTTGFLVRYYTIKAVDAFTKTENIKKAIDTLLIPPKFKNPLAKTIAGIKHYRFALGTFISIGIMMFTNFAIDAPLTKFLTNIFVKKVNDSEKNKIDKDIMNPQPSATVDMQGEKEKINNISFIPRPSMDSFTKRKEAE